jgi:hypothetical protein
MRVTLPATAFLALLLPFLPPRNSPLPAPWPPPLNPSIFQFQFAHILSRLQYEFAQPCLQRTLVHMVWLPLLRRRESVRVFGESGQRRDFLRVGGPRINPLQKLP